MRDEREAPWYDAVMRAPLKEIERIRAHRSGGGPDFTIGSVVERIGEAVSRQGRRSAEIVAAWDELIPPELAAHTRITAFRGGVIYVAVDESAAIYELDRLLRGGVEHEIRRRVKATVTRVKLAIGPLHDPSISPE